MIYIYKIGRIESMSFWRENRIEFWNGIDDHNIWTFEMGCYFFLEFIEVIVPLLQISVYYYFSHNFFSACVMKFEVSREREKGTEWSIRF